MKRDDYKRVVYNYKPDSNFQYRLKRRIATTQINSPRIGFKHKKIIVAAATISALVLFLAIGLPRISAPSEHRQIFSGFVFTAFAAESSDSILTPDYESSSHPTVLAPGITVNLPAYSPTMSSVPGFPFTLNSQEAKDKNFPADHFLVSADNGILLSWEIGTGKTDIIDAFIPVYNNETIYWSPLCRDTGSELIQDEVIITVRALIGDKQVSIQTIVIQENNGQYSARIE